MIKLKQETALQLCEWLGVDYNVLQITSGGFANMTASEVKKETDENDFIYISTPTDTQIKVIENIAKRTDCKFIIS